MIRAVDPTRAGRMEPPKRASHLGDEAPGHPVGRVERTWRQVAAHAAAMTPPEELAAPPRSLKPMATAPTPPTSRGDGTMTMVARPAPTHPAAHLSRTVSPPPGPQKAGAAPRPRTRHIIRFRSQRVRVPPSTASDSGTAARGPLAVGLSASRQSPSKADTGPGVVAASGAARPRTVRSAPLRTLPGAERPLRVSRQLARSSEPPAAANPQRVRASPSPVFANWTAPASSEIRPVAPGGLVVETPAAPSPAPPAPPTWSIHALAPPTARSAAFDLVPPGSGQAVRVTWEAASSGHVTLTLPSGLADLAPALRADASPLLGALADAGWAARHLTVNAAESRPASGNDGTPGGTPSARRHFTAPRSPGRRSSR